MDKVKRFIVLLLLLGYSILIFNLHQKFIWYSYFFIIYPSIRLILDFFLIFFSFFSEKQILLFIEKISHGKMSHTISWNRRLLGVLKWLMIHLIICLLCIILFKGYVHI